MADTEKKTYLVNVQSNLDKYIKEAAEAKKNVDALTASNNALKESGKATTVEIEKSDAALRNAKKEYTDAKKLVDLQTQANSSNAESRKQLGLILRLEQLRLGELSNQYVINEKGQRVLSAAYLEGVKRVKDAKDAIIAYDKAQSDGRSSVGLYTEAIEGALGKFQALPGPLSAAASSVGRLTTAFKTLIANPIVLAITAIIGVLGGLFKVFKSTAEGGGKIKDILASIGGVLNELRARVVSFIDIFKNIFSGNWKEAGQSIRDTFGGLGKSLADAAENAAELSRQQRALNKDLAMHVSEEANEINKIQEYLFLAKDKSRTDQERLNYLKEALRLGKEQAEREVEFSKRQWDIDVATAANKSKIDKKVLSDWVAMDQEAQLEMLNNRKDIQEAYNLIGGADALKALEESYSKQIQAQTEFFAHNKRAISQSSSLENELQKEKEEKYKAHLERIKKNQDDNIKLMFLEAGKDAEKRKAALKYQLDQELKQTGLSNTEKLILKKEYDNAVNAIDQEVVKASQEALQKEVDEYKKTQEEKKKADLERAEWELSRELENQENILQIKEMADADQFAVQKERLELQRRQELRAAEKTGADVNLINQKYSEARKQIDKLEADSRLAIYGDFAGSIASLFGKQTAIGKIAGVAQATINTYRAASEALATYPPPFSYIAMAAAILAGLANVKSIIAVKSGLPGDKSPSIPTAISSSVPAQRAFSTPVGASFLTQPQLTQSQVNTLPQSNPATAAEIAEAISKIPAPRVTVEDINARSADVRKVEVRATI